jgi:hypothetical protein
MDRVCPATLKVPVLEVPVLALTEKATAPLPVPLAPEVIPIQLSLLLAVQEQLLAVVTATLPLPGEARKEAGDGWLTSMEHVGADTKANVPKLPKADPLRNSE